MRTYKFICFIALSALCCACGEKKREAPIEMKTESFVLPEIPVILQSPDDRINFLANHYWDLFNFKDTTYIYKPEILEQGLSNYLNLLSHVQVEEDANNSLLKTLDKASQEKKMLNYFINTFRQYLFDPNSPMRNESLFEPVCQYASTSPKVNEAIRSRSKHDLKLITMNKVGTKATDFIYTLASGKQHYMSHIKSHYTLLLFYNPDCHECSEVLEYMKSSLVLNSPKIKKQLQILAFYPDEEFQIWERYQAQIPADWINSYDRELVLLNHELYDLKAMPTLYLLDKNKKVLLKDAPIEKIEHYLVSQ